MRQNPEYKRQYRIAKIAEARANGKCPRCFKRELAPSYLACSVCVKQSAEAMRKYYATHKEKCRAYQRARYPRIQASSKERKERALLKNFDLALEGALAHALASAVARDAGADERQR